MTDQHIPSPPPDLEERGRTFWTATLDLYELSDGEMQLLAEACRTLDNLDALSSVISQHGATTTGSTGQLVVNPAIQEARAQRVVLHRLLSALNLPDLDGDSIRTGHQIRAEAANRDRWKREA